MPTTSLPGMGASMRMERAASAMARSSDSPSMRDSLTRTSGFTSYWVTTGPLLTPTTCGRDLEAAQLLLDDAGVLGVVDAAAVGGRGTQVEDAPRAAAPTTRGGRRTRSAVIRRSPRADRWMPPQRVAGRRPVRPPALGPPACCPHRGRSAGPDRLAQRRRAGRRAPAAPAARRPVGLGRVRLGPTPHRAAGGRARGGGHGPSAGDAGARVLAAVTPGCHGRAGGAGDRLAARSRPAAAAPAGSGRTSAGCPTTTRPTSTRNAPGAPTRSVSACDSPWPMLPPPALRSAGVAVAARDEVDEPLPRQEHQDAAEGHHRPSRCGPLPTARPSRPRR